MTELLTPKLDLVFKSLFSQDTELLADLINAVLNPPIKTANQVGRTPESRNFAGNDYSKIYYFGYPGVR